MTIVNGGFLANRTEPRSLSQPDVQAAGSTLSLKKDVGLLDCWTGKNAEPQAGLRRSNSGTCRMDPTKVISPPMLEGSINQHGGVETRWSTLCLFGSSSSSGRRRAIRRVFFYKEAAIPREAQGHLCAGWLIGTSQKELGLGHQLQADAVRRRFYAPAP